MSSFLLLHQFLRYVLRFLRHFSWGDAAKKHLDGKRVLRYNKKEDPFWYLFYTKGEQQ